MRFWSSFRFPHTIIFFGFSIFLSPGSLFAKTIIVPSDFSSIQDAIDQAVSGDIIQVMARAENYEENIVLKDGITLEGLETARTIIDGTGSDVVITAGRDTTIRNLTITGGLTGIAASNISDTTISNNIIVGNTTGIDCPNSTDVLIHQNTIDDSEANGISCVSSQTVSITNNLITNNETGVSLSNITSLTVSNNGFHGNAENGEEGTSPVKAGDPLFVNALENDYYLKSGSPSPYRGSDLADPEDDLGVYGGSEADLTPFQIIGVSTSSGTDSINVSWRPNQAYNIAGYRIYFNKSKGVHVTPEETDTTVCDSNSCLFTITGLDNTVTEPAAPILQPAITGDQKLFLNWVPPTDQENIATYKVFWGTASGAYNDPASPKEVGNITSHTLLGLTNNITYFIAMKAVAQPRFFISVTAIDGASPPNESRFFEDQEVILTAAPAIESPFSNEVSEFPEAVIGFPNLPDEGGCFIATVAYGSALQPHVQILRAFRDQYLLPNALGRRFVSFYYHYGPSWAHFIGQHEFLKSLVRLLLLPFVALSYFFLTTTIVQKTGFLLALSIFFIFIMRRRARMLRGSVS